MWCCMNSGKQGCVFFCLSCTGKAQAHFRSRFLSRELLWNGVWACAVVRQGREMTARSDSVVSVEVAELDWFWCKDLSPTSDARVLSVSRCLWCPLRVSRCFWCLFQCEQVPLMSIWGWTVPLMSDSVLAGASDVYLRVSRCFRCWFECEPVPLMSVWVWAGVFDVCFSVRRCLWCLFKGEQVFLMFISMWAGASDMYFSVITCLWWLFQCKHVSLTSVLSRCHLTSRTS